MSIEAQLAATRKELEDFKKSFSMYQGMVKDEMDSLRHLVSLREAQLFGESGESVILNNPILYGPQIPTPKGVESFTTGAEGGGIPPAGTPEESETTFNRNNMARVLPTALDPNNVVDVFHTGVLFDGNTSVPGSIWRVGTSIGIGFPSSQYFVIEDDTGNYLHFGNGVDLAPHFIVNGTDLLTGIGGYIPLIPEPYLGSDGVLIERTWSAHAGSLPTGLHLDPSGGLPDGRAYIDYWPVPVSQALINQGSIDVNLMWSNSVGSNEWRRETLVTALGAGDTAGLSLLNDQRDVTVSAANTTAVSTVTISDLTGVAAGDLLLVRIGRRGDHANDDNTGDLSAWGAWLS